MEIEGAAGPGLRGGQVGPSPLSDDEFRVLYPVLRRFAAVVGDVDVDPDDLVQEAVVGYLRRFDGTYGADAPVAYLRSAILGLVSNHRRGMGRRRRRESLSVDVVHLESYPSDVVALLATTSAVERALLLLVDVDGEPVSEAAEVVGLSAVAARARLSRVRRRLRVELEGHDDD